MFPFRRIKRRQQKKQDLEKKQSVEDQEFSVEDQEFNEYIKEVEEKVNSIFPILQDIYLQYGYNEKTGEVYDKENNSIITDVSKILFVKTCYASVARYWGRYHYKFPNKESFIADMLCDRSDANFNDQHNVFNNESRRGLFERKSLVYLLNKDFEDIRIDPVGEEKRKRKFYIDLPIQIIGSPYNGKKEAYFYSNTAMVDLQIATARRWLRGEGKDIEEMLFTGLFEGSLENHFVIGDSLNNDYRHQFELVKTSVEQLKEDLDRIEVGNSEIERNFILKPIEEERETMNPANRVEAQKTFKKSLNANNPQWNQTTPETELTPEEKMNRSKFVEQIIKYYDIAENDELYQLRSESEEERMQQVAYLVNNNERMVPIKDSSELFQLLKAAQNLTSDAFGKNFLEELLSKPELNKALLAFKSSGAAEELREQALENKKKGYRHKLTRGEIDNRAANEFIMSRTAILATRDIEKSIASKFNGEDRSPYTREEKMYISFSRMMERQKGKIPGNIIISENGDISFEVSGNDRVEGK